MSDPWGLTVRMALSTCIETASEGIESPEVYAVQEMGEWREDERRSCEFAVAVFEEGACGFRLLRGLLTEGEALELVVVCLLRGDLGRRVIARLVHGLVLSTGQGLEDDD